MAGKDEYYNKSLRIAVLITVLILVIIGLYIFANKQPPSSSSIANFRDCVNAGYPVEESMPRRCRLPDGGSVVEDLKGPPPPVASQIRISGEISCLPKRGSGAQTMECAIGLKDQEGKYYALKNLSQYDPDYRLAAGGTKVEVSGLLTPEDLSGSDGNRYDIDGTIEVSSITNLSANQQSGLTEDEARAIAEQSCIKGGKAYSPGVYDKNTKTWWYDANLNLTKSGCTPACVVSEDTGTADTSWQCTGGLNQ